MWQDAQRQPAEAASPEESIHHAFGAPLPLAFGCSRGRPEGQSTRNMPYRVTVSEDQARRILANDSAIFLTCARSTSTWAANRLRKRDARSNSRKRTRVSSGSGVRLFRLVAEALIVSARPQDLGSEVFYWPDTRLRCQSPDRYVGRHLRFAIVHKAHVPVMPCRRWRARSDHAVF